MNEDENKIQNFFGLFDLVLIEKYHGQESFVQEEISDSSFFLFFLCWVLLFLKLVDMLFSRAEVALLGLFELYLLVFWGVCAGGFFVRGGLFVASLWTLWILFSCGVGAFLSVTVAEFLWRLR